MAVFQVGDPKAVGPVRSARRYYVGWAKEWRAIYAHAGGAPNALAAIREANRRTLWDADQFRYSNTLYRISFSASPRTTSTRRANAARAWADGSGPRRPSPNRPGRSRSLRTWPSGRWAARSRCRTVRTRSPTATPRDQPLRPERLRRQDAARRDDQAGRRAVQRGRPVHGHGARCATTASPATTRRRIASTSPTSGRARRSSSATARSSRPPGRRRARTPRPASSMRTGRSRAQPVPLVRGQIAIQVVPRATNVTWKLGRPAPPPDPPIPPLIPDGCALATSQVGRPRSASA